MARREARLTLEVFPEPLDGPDARRLIAELDAYLDSLYPPEDNFKELPAQHVDGGRGAFLVARVDGTAVGCAAIRMLSPAEGELKRMYVAPHARGRGVGRALVERVEAWARAAGASRLVLETGPKQLEAIALYERNGFAAIPCFGPYVGAPNSVCYGKDLD